jgi:hypothetical protein
MPRVSILPDATSQDRIHDVMQRRDEFFRQCNLCVGCSNYDLTGCLLGMLRGYQLSGLLNWPTGSLKSRTGSSIIRLFGRGSTALYNGQDRE